MFWASRRCNGRKALPYPAAASGVGRSLSPPAQGATRSRSSTWGARRSSAFTPRSTRPRAWNQATCSRTSAISSRPSRSMTGAPSRISSTEDGIEAAELLRQRAGCALRRRGAAAPGPARPQHVVVHRRTTTIGAQEALHHPRATLECPRRGEHRAELPWRLVAGPAQDLRRHPPSPADAPDVRAESAASILPPRSAAITLGTDSQRHQLHRSSAKPRLSASRPTM